jgi:glycosyltransferase involved in cell wall biosynthesis
MQLEKFVHLTGLISYDQIPSYLASSDFFITPSLSEVFPLSIIEAIGAGLPVLGINAPGISDIIVDEVNGLISRNDLSSFTDALLRLSSDSSYCKKLGMQAINSSRQYDIRLTTEILIQHYKRVVEASKQRTGIAI